MFYRYCPKIIGLVLCIKYAFVSIRPSQAQITPGGSGTTIQQNGQEFNITGGTQAGRNLFHTFQQFNLHQGQVANFFSNPSIANILARVNGGSASYINGLIQVLGGRSNLYLMNPAGIIFGPHASLNVPAAFIATTADRILFPGGSFNAYGNNDYSKLAGEPIGFAFGSKEPSAIINEGQLVVAPGQRVELIAGQVINTGTIQAPGGNITIAAVPGENLVRLSQKGQLLSLEFNPQHASQITDSQGNIPITRLPELLTGGGVKSVTQNNNHTVSVAGSMQQIPVATGTVVASGKLDVSDMNGTGGQAHIFGHKIAIVNGRIDASGGTGGGEILIGGDLQGKGSIFNAEYTFINRNSQLSADAINSGQGGRIIVWSDKVTEFLGTISARGGQNGGNGGFVEVSGKHSLNFQGQVDTSAPRGQKGTLLLDPANIVVGSDNDNDSELIDGQVLFTDSPGATFKISTNQLLTQLALNDVILQATNNVTFTENLFYSSQRAAQLTVEAGNRIQTEGIFVDSGSISLDFRAGNSILVNQPIRTSGGRVNLQATTGNITTQDIDTSGISGGSVSITSTNGSITTGSINTSGLADAGNVSIGSGRNITVDYINAQPSYMNGGGGTVNITAPQGTVRITGTFEPDISIAGGSITIRHGGNGVIPFIVGDASVNGSVGVLTARPSEIRPTQSFFVSTVVGDIRILTGETPSATKPEQPDIIPSATKPDQPNIINQILFTDPANPPALPTDETASTLLDVLPSERGEIFSRLPGDISQVLYLDQLFARLFIRSLDVQPLNNIDTISELQDELAKIAEKTGTHPAIVFLISDKEQLGIVVVPPGKRQSVASKQGIHFASTHITGLPVASVPIFRSVPQAKREILQATVQEFLNAIREPRQRTTQAYRQSGQQLYQWLIAPIEAELRAQGIDTLVFVPDEGLRTLPFAALWDGRQFLVEKFNLGQIPSVNLVDFNYQSVRGVNLLGMGASEFRNQESLKGVPIELAVITREWGNAKTFLNEQFTISNLIRERRQGGYVLVHLATHAEFRPRTLKDAYIEFWDGQLTLDRLRTLPLRQPAVELLVLSACRTAVGDPDTELGFAGLAVAAGVKSALASLWYVSDVGTVALMTEMYQQLQSAPIKAQALREAQLRMIRGQVRLQGDKILRDGRDPIPAPEAGLVADFSHPFYWAGFSLIGSPW